MPSFAPHPSRRTALVTGASSGIGAAVARQLGAAGFPVVLGARRLERCQQSADTIRSAGGEAHALSLDLADADSIGSFATRAEELAGPTEVLVACAGVSLPDSERGAFEQEVLVNLVGTKHLVDAVLAGMIGRTRGDLVFVTSEVVGRPRPLTAGYVASKWGMEGYARTLQMGLEGTGVRASIVQPGQTATEMGSGWDEAATSAILEEWARWGLARHSNFLSPTAVAEAVSHAVTTPRGSHLTMIEVQPEGPVRRQDR